MSGLKLRIENFVHRMFHDEIVDVNPPREWWMEYVDIGKRHEGYIVTATYKYSGEKDIYFDIDNDHFQLVSADCAFKRAQRFYLRALKQIQNGRAK